MREEEDQKRKEIRTSGKGVQAMTKCDIRTERELNKADFDPKNRYRPAQGIEDNAHNINLKVSRGFRKTASITQAGTTIVSAKPATRFLVHTAQISLFNLAAVAATGLCSITGTVKGSSVTLCTAYAITSKDCTVSSYMEDEILLDENTAISASWGATGPSGGTAIVTYTEIPVE